MLDGRVLAGHITHNTEEVRRGKGSFLVFGHPSNRDKRGLYGIVLVSWAHGTRGDTMGWIDYGNEENFTDVVMHGPDFFGYFQDRGFGRY